MFYKYEIKNNGYEDILYLYLTMAYEFSRELNLQASDEEMKRRTKNFIKNHGIDYHGNKVYLVIDGIVVRTVDIQNEKEDVEILKENLYYSNDYYLVSVELEDHSLVEMTLREYLLGVLATNMLPNLEIEALKALCILYRTYAFLQMNEKKKILSLDSFAIYKPISYYKLAWIDSYNDIVSKLEQAIKDTDCLFLTYHQYYILPFIHYSNHGYTLSHPKYPYLSSVRSLWDLASPYYLEIKDYPFSHLGKILKKNISSKSNFSILELDPNYFVKQLKIDDLIISGEEFQKKLQLKSLEMSLIVNRDFLRVITRGWGKFYGLSIFGANELAKNGCDYANILKYYFPTVKLNKYIKELS